MSRSDTFEPAPYAECVAFSLEFIQTVDWRLGEGVGGGEGDRGGVGWGEGGGWVYGFLAAGCQQGEHQAESGPWVCYVEYSVHLYCVLRAGVYPVCYW